MRTPVHEASQTAQVHRICVAPMLDWTTRHCRFFMRLLSARVMLYTEMITTGALLRGDSRRWLNYHPLEHPVGIQLGGSDPEQLAQCAQLCDEVGYDEINLNVGCPSDRVQAGSFGAALMAEPQRVADCVEAMRQHVAIPVSVKTRLGIDHRDSYEELSEFVAQIAAAGCRTVILHARKAWLQGLSPKENREIPPLQYATVHRIKRDFPNLEIVLNGGIKSLAEAEGQLRHVDGVMIGREAYQNPYMLAGIDTRIFGDPGPPPSREAVLESYQSYLELELERGTRLAHLTRHLLGLFQGQAGARRWRRILSVPADREGGQTRVIARGLQALREIPKAEADCA